MALSTLALDRKSTRLNSSHQIISYAVFCLKKKTIRCTAWPYALCHAALIKNIIPHSTLPPDMSLFELCMGNKPSVSTICTFGCNATLAIPDKQCNKLGNQSISGLHLGLALGKKAFLVYDPNTH